jgi:23S rRNA (cytosine1962-C5)-methyltransferase
MNVWRLKKGADQRLRSRHPWVFSNELMVSPKGILPGEPIEIQDIKGNFLARGYGNPNSLIAFRALSFELKNLNPHSIEMVADQVERAWVSRVQRGCENSYRICFSEADQLPGLVIDRYLINLASGSGGETVQCLSVQLTTAGMERIFQNGEAILKLATDRLFAAKLISHSWEKTIMVYKNSSLSRKLEGLPVQTANVIRNPEAIDLSNACVMLQNRATDFQLSLNCDILNGQKTGLFLDQSGNIEMVVQLLKKQNKFKQKRKYKVLDLCCYMGQWSAYLVQLLLFAGHDVEVCLADISDLALQKAEYNLKKIAANLNKNNQIQVSAFKLDVMKISDETKLQLPENNFDVVISDPPAFVKNKKVLESGLHGYMKLNELAFKWASNDSLVVSCTCSGLVELNDFKSALRKGLLRSGKKAQIIGYGTQGVDHPQSIYFPEGEYLKMVVHHTF